MIGRDCGKEWHKDEESLTTSLKLLFLFCFFLLLMVILFTILIIEIPIGKAKISPKLTVAGVYGILYSYTCTNII